MKISVFGNPDLKEDNAAIKLVPWLKKKYPAAEIKIEDPSSGLEPSDDWLIVDTCAGIDKITEFEDLDQFESARRVSVIPKKEKKWEKSPRSSRNLRF